MSERDESHRPRNGGAEQKNESYYKKIGCWMDDVCEWIRGMGEKNGKGKIKSEEVAQTEADVSSGKKNAEIRACGYEHSV